MTQRLRNLGILFLAVTLVALGFVQAGAGICAPGCPECFIPEAVSCCKGMAPAAVQSGKVRPGKTEPGLPACHHQEVCPEMSVSDAEISVPPPSFDLSVLLPAGDSWTGQFYHVNSFSKSRLPLPPLSSYPSLSIRNCVFLI